ncbi:MAG: hypothetical protein ACJ8C4_17755 [Gemmataceae bacterium]
MRRRRQLYVLLAATSLLLVVVGAGLALALKHEPSFYRRTAIAEGAERQQLSQEFLKSWSSQLIDPTLNGQPWALNITQDQLNGYLQEDEQTKSTSLFTFPDGVSDPRIEFDQDRFRVGFRYGSGWSAVVVSVDIKTWLVAKEPNVIALELCNIYVGGLPLSSHSIMEYVTEAAREQNADVTWYRSGSHPIALMRLQANLSRPTLVIRRFEIQSGKLLLNGKPTGDVAPPPETTAAGQ